MQIIEILPELDIGGVERHVIDLSNELAARGHDVIVISAGGKMQSQLASTVRHINMQVHKKNPFTIWRCSKTIATFALKENVQILHAHSRVPAWIARWAAKNASIPYVVTAHVDFGNKSPWIYAPYRDAARVICVSEAVREGMKECFYKNTQVILNGLDEPKVHWREQNQCSPVKFLFVGRLSLVKGLQDVLNAMPDGDGYDWTLDVLGDGPAREELESIVKERHFENKVLFHGYSDKTDEFMAESSCLLFPSHREGFGLVLARAAQIGLPILATDISTTAELAGSHEGLIPPGNIDKWSTELNNFIKTRKSKVKIPLESIPTMNSMVTAVEDIYYKALNAYRKAVIKK